MTAARLALIFACALHLVLGSWAAWRDTPTIDEFAHVPAGLVYWKHGRFDLYAKNPPLIKLWLTWPTLVLKPSVPEPEGPALGWGPWIYGSQFERANQDRYFEVFILARLMNLVLSLSAGLLVFFWARRTLGNEWAGAISASGLLLSPTILAHAHLATVDVGAMVSILAFCFFLDVSKKRMSAGRYAVAGALLGLALGAKFTGVFLLPLFLLFACLQKKRAALWGTPLALLTALLVLNSSYGFRSTLEPLPKLQAKTTQFFAKVVPDFLLIPLPRDFLVGFDAQTLDTEQGEFGSYLLGQWSNEGWWYYNFAAFLLKETPLLIALLLIAFPIALARTSERNLLLPFLAPIFFIGVPLSIMNKLQIGVRYLLPLFPFLFLLVGFTAYALKARPRACAACIATWGFVALLAAPNFITYFNAPALAFKNKIDLLLDSNLDWGQDLYRLKNINRETNGAPIGLVYFGHVSPELYGIRYQLVPPHPVKGLLAVSANFLMGYPYVAPAPDGTFVQISPDHLRWLRPLTPTRELGSILIFDTRQ